MDDSKPAVWEPRWSVAVFWSPEWPEPPRGSAGKKVELVPGDRFDADHPVVALLPDDFREPLREKAERLARLYGW